MSTISPTTKSPTRADREERHQAVTSFDDTRLFVRYRHGPAPATVILCDGILCDGFIYRYLWDDLADIASVAHFHYRGHGRSALPADPANIGVEHFARDVDAVRRALGDPPVVLVGHSVGTQVALEAYRLRPERVIGLGLLCGSYGRVTYTFHGTNLLATWLPDLIRFAIEHPKLVRALWTRLPPRLAVRVAVATGEVNGGALNAEDLEPYFEHLAHVDLGLFLRMLERAGEHSLEDFLGQVSPPTLVVAGDRDSFTPPELSHFMADALPNSELVLIPGGSHIAPLENREAVAECMRSLIARALTFGGFTDPPSGI